MFIAIKGLPTAWTALGLTSENGEALQLPSFRSIQILLNDTQTNVLQHEVEKLRVALLNACGHVRLLSGNKVR